MIRAARTLVLLSLSVTLLGCASIFRPLNEPITHNPDGRGYSLTEIRDGNLGDDMILVTFSGGGTRAAALAYGVLKELHDTTIISRGHRISMLDELDSISAVSGGSFTAAYYGLFGDRIFKDYEDVFLKKSIQGILIQKLFDPSYWWRSVSTGFDRTEMAIEYYDGNIFEGKQFKDFDLRNRPFIEINATNLGGASRFSFNQVYFDAMCTNLMDLKVARAVTASSAVPIMFAPVVLKNYSNECDPRQSPTIRAILDMNDKDPRAAELKNRLNRFLDHEHYPYVHLIDGGVADNLGARAMTERLEAYQGGLARMMANQKPKNIVMITVDAEVEAVHSVDESSDKPSLGDYIDAFANVQFKLFNNETRILLDDRLVSLKARLESEGHKINLYQIPVTFSSVAGKSLKDHLNSLPTSLELEPSDVDLLTRTGGDLLRQSKAYRAFLESVDGRRIDDPTLTVATDAPSKDKSHKHHHIEHPAPVSQTPVTH